MRHPNGAFEHVVLISLDTLRSDCVCANPVRLWPAKYGLEMGLRTTLLDQIAGDGAFFANCITAAPYTSAAHATYFTGKFPLRHGVFELFNRKLASPSIFTVAKRFGYSTLFKVDFPVILGDMLGFTQGVDRYVVEDDDQFLAALDPHVPMVSFAHFGGLHVPYGFHNLHYGGEAYVTKVKDLEEEIQLSAEGVADQLVETYRSATDLDLMLRYKRIVQHHYTRGDYRRLFSLYLEGVNFFMANRFEPFMDRLLDKLKGSRYLIVIFGDHGEEYDEDSYAHHNTLSEGVLRVPVIFLGQDIQAGRYMDRIRSIDVAPTVLDLMAIGSRSSLRMDGQSLTDTLRSAAPYPVRPAFAQVYTAETKEYLNFQRRVLVQGRKTGSLRHVLYKEAVYRNNLKFTRQSYHYTQAGGIWGLSPCEPRLTLERMDSTYIPRPHVDRAAIATLTADLDAYNRMRPGVRTQARLSQHIRNQPQARDYRI